MKVSDPVIERALALYPEEIKEFLRKGKSVDGKDHLDLDIDGTMVRLSIPAKKGDLQPA